MTLEIKNLLKKIENDDIFNDFYFIGGTALAYYLNHRVSYDLDFISLAKLKVSKLKSLVIRYDAKFIVDKQTSVFKINTGNNIEEYKLIFNIDDIKIEFFHPNDILINEIILKYKHNSKKINQCITILPLEAIAKLKLLAFFRRTKLRDLFDIYVLLNQKKIDLDDIEKFYSLEVGKNTLVEFIEDFKDDGSESLDFDPSSIYYNDFSELTAKEKIDKIKIKFINLIVNIELNKKALLL